MSAWARPGIKCVCIYEGPAYHPVTGERKEWSADKGRVYTIVHILERDGTTYLGLWGMPLDSYLDVAGFRPLVSKTQEDDVRLIKSLLLDDAGLVPAGMELVP